MSGKANRVLTYQFAAGLETIYPYISDFKTFGHLHPNMKVVNHLGVGSNGGKEYEVFEEIALLWVIKMKPYYKAEILELEKNKHIRYLSQVQKGIHLTIDFKFETNPDLNRVSVTELVEVTGNVLIANYFINLLSNIHKGMFEKLADGLRR